jgi:hypothetical protein
MKGMPAVDTSAKRASSRETSTQGETVKDSALQLVVATRRRLEGQLKAVALSFTRSK